MARGQSPLDVGIQFGDAMKAASKALVDAERDVLSEAATVARKELSATARLVPGADRRFSRWDSAGPLGVTMSMRPGELSVTAAGPWGLAETGARAHSAKAWGRGSFSHPGTTMSQGKRSWSRGAEATFKALELEVPERISRAVLEAVEAS